VAGPCRGEVVPTTKLAMDGEAAEGRREGEMERAGAVAQEPSRPLRNASIFDRDEKEDMTAATCSKPSPNPAAGRGCIDSSATIDEDIDTDASSDTRTCTRVQRYGAVCDQLGRWMERSALGPRTSLLSLSWLLPSFYISTSLDLHISLVTYMCLPFPTLFAA